jgi:protein-arginine kinase activator protein McsA
MRGPTCGKCQQAMTWVAEQIVDTKPMQVFHCENCDKYAAALPGTNGVSTSIAPGLVTGL